MKEAKPFKIRLNKLKLVNFKCFEKIELEFTKPFHNEDLDVFVMGSRNGLGKTSILEACSLLFLSLMFDRDIVQSSIHKLEKYSFNFRDYFIKSGRNLSTIEGFFEINNKKYSIELEIAKNSLGYEINHNLSYEDKEYLKKIKLSPKIIDELLLSMISSTDKPFILSPVMYFNSNRKIKMGNSDLSNITGITALNSRIIELDSFKDEIIKVLMAKSGLFEDLGIKDVKETQEFLNLLCKEYAGGTIEKLSQSYELRITPTGGGEPFSFDGLSSGQKEIISTLFLIWKNTKDQSGIILIDEPELHLNAEWQHKFIKTLRKLSPHNQYILATHSKHIFGSVDPEYRCLIRPDSYNED